jgi:sensor histidine kinase YesM
VRLSKRVKLEYHNSITETGLVISPFLLIPFIENTFKYGINSQQDSHIVIKVQLKRNELYLQAFNNKVVIDELRDDKVGLGISNTRQRLNLLYPSKHLLTITETEKDFSVSLHIKLT